MNATETKFYDKNGIPILPGDLLRSFHFKDTSGQDRFLYHVVVVRRGNLYMEPPAFLYARGIGGDTTLTRNLAMNAEIVDGYGDDGTFYAKRRKKEPDPIEYKEVDVPKTTSAWGGCG